MLLFTTIQMCLPHSHKPFPFKHASDPAGSQVSTSLNETAKSLSMACAWLLVKTFVILCLGFCSSLLTRLTPAHPKCCRLPCFQLSQILPCCLPPALPPLTACACSYRTQTPDAGVEDYKGVHPPDLLAMIRPGQHALHSVTTDCLSSPDIVTW